MARVNFTAQNPERDIKKNQNHQNTSGLNDLTSGFGFFHDWVFLMESFTARDVPGASSVLGAHIVTDHEAD